MPNSKPNPPAGIKPANHWLARYVFALLSVAAAFLLRLGLTRLAGGSLPTYITFYPAVMLPALLGGVGPGLLATVAAALVVDYFILPPLASFTVASLADAIGLAFFTGMGVFMSVVAELYRRARQQVQAHEAEAYLRDHLPAPARWSKQGILINAGLAAALAILAAAAWQSVRNLRSEEAADERVTHTYIVIQSLDRLQSALESVESDQRGFLLNGEENYLEPYRAALDRAQTNLASLKLLTQDNPRQQQRLARIESVKSNMVATLEGIIALRRARGLPAAGDVAAMDKGEDFMVQIRQQIADAQIEEEGLLQTRAGRKAADTGRTLPALLAGSVLSFLLLITVFLYLKQENIRRAKAEADARHHRDHLKEMVAARTEELALSNQQLKQEIHGHQQAKEALRQQREWLRVTLTSIGDAVLATDTAGQITFLNPVAQSLTGWPESEVLGQPVQSVFRIINQQTRAPGEDIVARVLREGQAVALANHTALLARDGREIPIEDSAAPIRDAGGTISGVVLVFHDVTQKRRAQEALRESRERLDLALVSSRMATFDWDIVQDKRTWSQGVHSLLGTSAETFTGTAGEFFQIVHPEDRSAVQAAIDTAVEKTGVYETEYRAVWPDASIHHIAARGKIHRDSAGRAVLLTGVCWDITTAKRVEDAMRQSEARYRILFNTLIEGFCIIEVVFDARDKPVDYRFLEVNPSFENQTGLRDARGKLMRDLAPQHEAHWFEIYGKVALTGEPARFVNEARALGRWFDVSAYRVGGPESRRVAILFSDITRSKRAEAARAQLAAIVESSDDAILSKDLDGTITSWNAGAQRLFGYLPGEVMGRSIKLLLPPDRQDEETPIMARLQAGERVEHFETVRVAKDGRNLAVSVTISPLKDAEGRIIGASKISHDITERKQREEELQRLNRTLKALRESSQAMTRATSEAEYLDEVCKNVIANCGHAMVWIGFAEQDQARTVRPAAFAGFDEGYIETLKVSWADTERGRGPTGTAIRTGKPFLCGNLLANPAMAPWRAEILKRGYASSLVVPLLSQGSAFGAITIYSLQPNGFSEDEARLLAELADDVSNCIRALRAVALRRRAERRTELLAEAASRFLSSDDPQRVVDELCGKVLEFLDCQLFFNFLVDDKQQRLRLNACAGIPKTDAGRIEWLDHCAALCRSAARDGCRFVAGGIQAASDPRTDLIKPYGIEAYACHPLMVSGKLFGSLSFGTRTRKNFTEEDLSLMKAVADLVVTAIERKRAQAALQLTAEEVKRSNRDLEQFAYIASHDLQEPLRAVGGYVKLLERRFPQNMDPKALEFIRGAAEGADRMERLISDLLAFSRVGSRGGAFSPADLNAVLNEALQNLHSSIKSTQAKITRDAMPSLAVDATQMMQIFQNLIGNAIKFRSQRPPEIHVGVQKQPGQWVFSVRDNGIGIEPQYFERIFQIFQRLHTRQHYPGTGIGLAICKKVVERHDGAIWVESVPGQGSTFFFSLPENSAILQRDV